MASKGNQDMGTTRPTATGRTEFFAITEDIEAQVSTTATSHRSTTATSLSDTLTANPMAMRRPTTTSRPQQGTVQQPPPPDVGWYLASRPYLGREFDQANEQQIGYISFFPGDAVYVLCSAVEAGGPGNTHRWYCYGLTYDVTVGEARKGWFPVYCLGAHGSDMNAIASASATSRETATSRDGVDAFWEG